MKDKITHKSNKSKPLTKTREYVAKRTIEGIYSSINKFIHKHDKLETIINNKQD